MITNKLVFISTDTQTFEASNFTLQQQCHFMPCLRSTFCQNFQSLMPFSQRHPIRVTHRGYNKELVHLQSFSSFGLYLDGMTLILKMYLCTQNECPYLSVQS